MKRRRGLREEDRRLWERVTKDVAPLRKAPMPAPEAPPGEPRAGVSFGAVEAARGTPGAAVPPAEPVKRAQRPHAKAKASPAPSPAPGDIDRTTRRRIARGTVPIDGRIDLHGMTQEEAHGALLRFIEASLAARRKVVLVITGKGRGGDGVLRRMVPHWLASKALSRVVVSFGEASAAHGGDGAMYVRLRAPEKAARR